MKILGVITARGGSKLIPKKNIKLLGGKPLIAHTIGAAQKSGVFDRIILSTDNEHIAAVAKEYGCEVPFMRPKELAEDNIPHLPVLQHAVNYLKKKEGYEPDYVMILQPTSPLRQAFHIKEAVDLILKTGVDSVLSVSLVPGHYNPHWQFLLSKENKLSIFTGEPFSKIVTRRQDLQPTYSKDGAIWIFKTKLLFSAEPSFYGDDVQAYIIEEKYNINIDSEDDWSRAEVALKLL
jgi:CMP-N,N'-diacetyllegionaminic acid synthase